jgi:hypothetical protein
MGGIAPPFDEAIARDEVVDPLAQDAEKFFLATCDPLDTPFTAEQVL